MSIPWKSGSEPVMGSVNQLRPTKKAPEGVAGGAKGWWGTWGRVWRGGVLENLCRGKEWYNYGFFRKLFYFAGIILRFLWHSGVCTNIKLFKQTTGGAILANGTSWLWFAETGWIQLASFRTAFILELYKSNSLIPCTETGSQKYLEDNTKDDWWLNPCYNVITGSQFKKNKSRINTMYCSLHLALWHCLW